MDQPDYWGTPKPLAPPEPVSVSSVASEAAMNREYARPIRRGEPVRSPVVRSPVIRAGHSLGPWEPSISGNGEDGYLVYVNGGKIRSFEFSTFYDVTFPDETDEGTQTMPAEEDDVVFIKLNPSTETAEVLVGPTGAGSDWEGYPDRADFDATWPYIQSYSYIELAKVVRSAPEDEDSPLVLEGEWKSGNMVVQYGFSFGKQGRFAQAGN